MKKLIFIVFFLPSISFAQRFGSIRSGDDVSLSSNSILNRNTLQSGSTFYVSSGTIAGTLRVGDEIIAVRRITAGDEITTDGELSVYGVGQVNPAVIDINVSAIFDDPTNSFGIGKGLILESHNGNDVTESNIRMGYSDALFSWHELLTLPYSGYITLGKETAMVANSMNKFTFDSNGNVALIGDSNGGGTLDITQGYSGLGSSDSTGIYLHAPLGSTVFGMRIDGYYTDGIRFDGELKTSDASISNLFSFHDASLWAPSATAKTAWSFGAAPVLYSTRTANALYGFLSSPFTRSSPPSFSYTSTATYVVAYEASPLWSSGRAENFILYHASPTGIVGGTVGNAYGLKIENITGATTNYAIKTGQGIVELGTPGSTSALRFSPASSSLNLYTTGSPSWGFNFLGSDAQTVMNFGGSFNSYFLTVSTNLTTNGLRTRMQVQGNSSTVFNDWNGANAFTIDVTSISLINQKNLLFYDSDSSNYVGLKSSSSLSGNTILVLPSSDGSPGQSLITDGNGNLSFSTISGGGGVTVYPASATASFPFGFSASTAVYSESISVSDNRSGSDFPTKLGISAFPNAPASTDSGLALDGLIDPSSLNPLKAGMWTEIGYLFNVGMNAYGQGDVNSNVQGSYFRFNGNPGEPPLSVAVKDNLGLISASDIPAYQVSEYGTMNLGRGWAIPDNTHDADVHIRSYNGDYIPLIIDHGSAGTTDLTVWKNSSGNKVVSIDAAGSITSVQNINGSYITASSGTFTSSISLTGIQISTNITSPRAATIVIASPSGSRTYTIPEAGANASFVMTAGNQSIGGIKTLTANPVVNGNNPTITFDDTTGTLIVEDYTIAVDEGVLSITNKSDSKSGIVISANEEVGLGQSQSPSSVAWVVIPAADGTSHGQILLTPGTVKVGGLSDGIAWFDTNTKNFGVASTGLYSFMTSDVAVATKTATVSNSTTETSLWREVMSDTTTISSGYLTLQKTFRIEAWGRVSTDAASFGGIEMRVRFGTITVLDSGSVSLAPSLSDELWKIEGLITVRTTGSAGTVMGQGIFTIYDSVGTILRDAQMKNLTPVIVPTTSSRTIDLTAQFDTANANNSISLDVSSLQIAH